VLTLLARNKSNKEIGLNLFISETTVKGHLQHPFKRTALDQFLGTAKVGPFGQ
jgi:DNA-binding NarL/FixJ family response regulator